MWDSVTSLYFQQPFRYERKRDKQARERKFEEKCVFCTCDRKSSVTSAKSYILNLKRILVKKKNKTKKVEEEDLIQT